MNERKRCPVDLFRGAVSAEVEWLDQKIDTIKSRLGEIEEQRARLTQDLILTRRLSTALQDWLDNQEHDDGCVNLADDDGPSRGPNGEQPTF